MIIRKTVLKAEGGVEIPIEGTSGQKGVVVFRPQSVQIKTDLQSSDSAVLNGIIESLEFLGSTVRYNVKVGAVSVLVDQDHQRGKRVFAENEELTLVIPQKQLFFIPE